MNKRSVTCVRCNRGLKDKKSIAIGIGRKCLAKQKAEGNKAPDLVPCLPFDPKVKDVVLSRTETGPKANIPHTIVRHSPDGFDWGYEGSGPADLALNILYYFTRDKVFSEEYHQEFKRDFISRIPEAGGVLPGPGIEAWIYLRLNQQTSIFDIIGDDID